MLKNDEPMQSVSEKRPKTVVAKSVPLFGLIILMVTIAGLAVDVHKTDGDNFYKDFIRLQNVVLTVHQKYVEKIDSKQLADHAIDGMLSILDPHSNYMEKKQYNELMIKMDAQFGGLGIQIAIRDKVLTVMTPISGTPAERAGIQSGDQIVKINGKSTAGINIEEAVSKLRGEPGTDVTITIRRPGEKDLDYTITRGIIHIKAVPFANVFNDSVGYVELREFSNIAGKEVEKAIKELLKKKIKGIILDLRSNPGGALPQAIEVAEKFLPEKSLIVYTKGRMQGQNYEYNSSSSPLIPSDMPMVVLVNYASASASEIVAGAIQDWDKGLIIGDTTFGKGSVQTLLPLDEDHHIKLTTAFYYTPSGRCINKPENGIRAKGLKSSEKDDDAEDSATVDESKSKDKADSTLGDTTTYRTKKGRIVHGGGGIVPDTVIKPKLWDYSLRLLYLKDAFFSFANKEHPKLKAQHAKIDKSFVVTDAIFNDFLRHLDSINFKFQNQVQMQFEDFKVRSGMAPDTSKKAVAQTKKDSVGGIAIKLKMSKEELSASEKTGAFSPDSNFLNLSKEDREILQKLTSQIDQIFTKNSKNEFVQNAPQIKKYIREALLARENGSESDVVYRSRLDDDVQFQAALSLLSNRTTYDRLLKPKSK
jgi:carboxyl-terminal processing protease